MKKLKLDWTAVLISLIDQGVDSIYVSFSGNNIESIYFEQFPQVGVTFVFHHSDINCYNKIITFISKEIYKYTGKFYATRSVSTRFTIYTRKADWYWEGPGFLNEGKLRI